MARNVLISRRDWIQINGVSLTGGFWRLPLSNMLDYRPKMVAEAWSNVDLNSTQFQVDLGVSRLVKLFFFANLRASSMGFLSLKAGNDPTFAVNTYEIDTTCWPQDSDAMGYNAWGEFTLNGVYLADEYESYGMSRFLIPDTQISCRYVDVRINDITSATNLQIGCFGVCDMWEAPQPLAVGWQITSIDESDVQMLPFGTTEIVRRNKRRRLNLGFPSMTESEIWARSFGLVAAAGRSTPVVAVPFSDIETRLEKSAIYGLFSSDNPLSNPNFGLYAQNFQIDELR